MTRVLLAALAALLPAAPASAAGAATLRRALSTRAAGMANAYSAVAGGLSSLSTNPAGLAAGRKSEIESAFASGVLDDTFGFVAGARPLPLGTLAAGLSYYDAGKVDLHFANGTTEIRTAQRDFVGHLAWGVALPGGLSAGATGKFFRFELAQEAKASGAAADLGLQWRAPVKGLALGAAVQNLGAGVRYESEREPLPTTARGGASWAWASREPAKDTESTVAATRFLAVAEAVKERDVKAAGALGAEIAMDFSERSSIALRAGWTLNSDASRLSVGLGIRDGRWTLDYALGEKRTLGQTHQVGFGLKF